VQAPEGEAVTSKVIEPPEGALTVKFCVSPTSRFARALGENSGMLVVLPAVIVIAADADERGLLPIALVATTFIV
jgi:hypothetical protein